MHRLDSATRTRREKTLLRTGSELLHLLGTARPLPLPATRLRGVSYPAPPPAAPGLTRKSPLGRPPPSQPPASRKPPRSARCRHARRKKSRGCGKKRAHTICPSLPALPIAPVRASPHRQSPAPDSARLCSGDRWVADTTSRRPSQPRHPQSGQTCRRSERRCRRPRPLA